MQLNVILNRVVTWGISLPLQSAALTDAHSPGFHMLMDQSVFGVSMGISLVIALY